MLSKNRTKFLISLQKKKVRQELGLFVIEGDKLVKEFLLSEIPVRNLIAVPEFINSLQPGMKGLIHDTDEVSIEELKLLSTLKTPHNALAVVEIPKIEFNKADILNRFCVALDFIQDPGNMGTIIRAAAWFGIENIVCSENCVDLYNPKVIQASMGAILHVNVFYTDLNDFLKKAAENKTPVYGTLLDGKSVYKHQPAKTGIILLGNESNGISPELIKYVSEKIMIPKFSESKYGIDSLNVGMAASVIFSEFIRKTRI